MKTKTNFSKEVILITGCSSGIGIALAKKLYDLNEFKVVITARSKSIEMLKNQFKENSCFIIREMDLNKSDHVNNLVSEVFNLWGRIDILVNNAGVCYRSVVEQMDEKSELQQMQTNYLSAFQLIRLLLPSMRERKYGKIINISSVSGILGMPTMSSYSASKHALEGASISLWYEMRQFGISVTIARPGFINSTAYKRVVLSKKAQLASALNGPYSEYYKFISPFVEKFMKISFCDSNKAANKVLRLVKKKNPPAIVSITLDAIIFEILQKLLPSTLFLKFISVFLPNGRTNRKSITDSADSSKFKIQTT